MKLWLWMSLPFWLLGCGSGLFNLDGSSASGTGTSVASTRHNYFLLALDGTSSKLRSYSIDGTSGALTFTGSSVSAAGAYVAAVSADGKRVFTVGGTAVNSFTLDASTGGLAAAGSLTLPGANATFVSVHPSGKYLYVSDGTSSPSAHVYVLNVDATTAALSNNSNVTNGGLDFAHCVVVNPAGTFAFAADYAGGLGTGDLLSAFTINSSTGALTAAAGSPYHGGNPANVADPRNLAVDPSGKYVYLVDESSNPTRVSSYSVNASTGALTVIGSAAPGAGNSVGGGINVSTDGKFVLATNRGGNSVSTYSVGGTGALTFASTALTTGSQPVSIAIHPAAGFVYVSHQSSGDISAFAYNSSSGALTALSPANYSLSGSTNSAFVAVAQTTP